MLTGFLYGRLLGVIVQFLQFAMDRTIISRVLQECYSQLADGGFYSPALVARLYSRHCINTEEKQDIEAGVTQMGKSRGVLDILIRK